MKMKTSKTLSTLGLALLLCAPAHASKAGKARRSASPGKARELVVEGVRSLKALQYNGAISVFQKAIKADAGSAEAFYWLGTAYYQRAFQTGTPDKADAEDSAQAVDALQTAASFDPSMRSIPDPYLLFHSLAQSQEALGRYEESAGNMKMAMKASPNNPMPPLYAAELRYRMRDMKRSAENLHMSVQKARRTNSYRSLAKLIRSHPQFSSLLLVPQNQAILSIYDQVEAGTLTEAQAKEQVEERANYRDSLKDSVKDPSLESRQRIAESPLIDPKVYESMNKANDDFRFRRYRQAIIAYQQALMDDRERGTLDGAAKAVIYENIGSSYRQLGAVAEAVRSLERAAIENPTSSNAYYQMALAYSTAGQFNRAINALDQALKNARTVPELRKTLLMAKTDLELEPVRDLPAFQRILAPHQTRLQARVE